MVEIFGSCGYNKKEHEQEARNMYEYDSRVRLSEVDQHQRMTLNAVLNYFQDCSSFHSEDLGVSERTQSNVGAAVMEDRCGPLSIYG